MSLLKQAIPDAETLLSLPVEELAYQLLKIASNSLSQLGMTHIQNFTAMVYDPHNPSNSYPQSSMEVINLAIYEAWNWLTVQGLLIPVDGYNGTNGFLRLGRRSAELLDEMHFKNYTVAIKFNKEFTSP